MMLFVLQVEDLLHTGKHKFLKLVFEEVEVHVNTCKGVNKWGK